MLLSQWRGRKPDFQWLDPTSGIRADSDRLESTTHACPKGIIDFHPRLSISKPYGLGRKTYGCQSVDPSLLG